ncbi:MAG: LytTR family DNA-binding domain-containing protein [Bacteroidota bacterium]
MNIEDLKAKALARRAQAIIFDGDGAVKASDEALGNFLGGDFNWFEDTFLSGMETSIRSLTIRETLSFQCVQMTLSGKERYCDITIERLAKDQWLCLIYDFSAQYRKVFEMQQQRNLAEIKSHKFERTNTSLSHDNEALRKLYEELKDSAASEYILIRADKLLVNLDLRTINYLEAYGDYVKIHTTDRLYLVYSTFAKIEATLPPSDFSRVHRSYIVRHDKIENIDQLSLSIASEVLPMGKTYKTELLRKMGQL